MAQRANEYKGWWVTWLAGEAHATTRLDGKRRRIGLGVKKKSEAAGALVAFVNGLQKEAIAITSTVAMVWDAYCADRKADGKIMRPFYDRWKHLGPFFGERKLDEINADLCREYAKQKFTEDLSPWSVWGHLNVLSSALGWAHKRNLIQLRPYVWKPLTPDGRKDSLDHAQVDALIDACTDAHLRLFVILALTTAGRMTALLELTWDRVDFGAGTIELNVPRVFDPMSKAFQKGRATVPMNAVSRAALVEARATNPEGCNHVIHWRGEGITNIARSFAVAVKTAGLPDTTTPHVLRHTSASWLNDAGVDIETIARYLGHKDPNTTRKIYIHASTTEASPMGEAAKKLTVGRSTGLRTIKGGKS